jgi:hypothetical protein
MKNKKCKESATRNRRPGGAARAAISNHRARIFAPKNETALPILIFLIFFLLFFFISDKIKL